jgi:glycine cleavage system H protein
MNIDETCKYTESHEWIRVEGDEGVCGISDYAQEQLSDVVYVELPEEGDTLDQGEAYATVESVKAAADVYMPVGGEILEINEALEDEPELVNHDPFGEAWLVRIRIADPAELDDLLDPDAYAEVVEREMAEGH